MKGVGYVYSEVAHMRERREREYQAERAAIEGLSFGGAKHRFITKKMGTLACSRLVGEENMMEVFNAR